MSVKMCSEGFKQLCRKLSIVFKTTGGAKVENRPPIRWQKRKNGEWLKIGRSVKTLATHNFFKKGPLPIFGGRGFLAAFKAQTSTLFLTP